jgi:hypothetical protein
MVGTWGVSTIPSHRRWRRATGRRPLEPFEARTKADPRQVEAKGLEPSNLLTASQALYQLSYAPGTSRHVISPAWPDHRVRTGLGPVPTPNADQVSASGETKELSGAIRPVL